MIIIKIMILYFIQIRHTDDFPSTGTRLVHLTIISERIIELEHNRSVQSTNKWHLSIGTHFEILTHIKKRVSLSLCVLSNS